MQGLILAAGMGNRLGKHTKDNTKCMVKVHGKHLIHYTLEALSTVKLDRIVIVIGYEGDKLRNFLGDSYNGIPIVYVCNDIYNKTNNIYSLWLAQEYFVEDDTILLESDLIFEKKIIEDVVENPNPNLAVVAKYESWMDGTVTLLDESDRIVSVVPKKNFKWDSIENYYKTANIYKFSKEFIRDCYMPFLDAYIKALGNNEYYEQVLRVIAYLENINLKGHRLVNEKWYEIDDVQDLDIAEVLFAQNDAKLGLYQKRFGGYWRFPRVRDFCYLVNPYFPTQGMLDELKSNFNILISEYPSGLNTQNLLASKLFGCEPNEILVGNGAAELIKGLLRGLEGNIGVIYPTFNEYPENMNPERIKRFIPDNRDFSYGVEDLKKFSEGIDALLLINPDNPSGNFLGKEEVIELVEYLAKRNITLIYDESFVDFANQSETFSLISSEYLEKYNNLVVIKSISKSYGVPGIRLGVLASGDRSLIARVRKEISIWNINSFGEYFLQIIGKYKSDYVKGCREISSERDRLFEELSGIGFIRVIPSRANYFLCELTSGVRSTELANVLLNKYDILIKDLSGKIAFENKEYIRIAVRDREDNDFLVRKLREIEKNRKWLDEAAVSFDK